jgi:hypothetical protein
MTSEKLTGRWKVAAGLFGPTVHVQIEESWDPCPEHGMFPQISLQWRKATNTDLLKLNLDKET